MKSIKRLCSCSSRLARHPGPCAASAIVASPAGGRLNAAPTDHVLDPWNRGPPAPPAERPYVQPGPQVSPPMDRVTPVAPLSPRVGN